MCVSRLHLLIMNGQKHRCFDHAMCHFKSVLSCKPRISSALFHLWCPLGMLLSYAMMRVDHLIVTTLCTGQAGSCQMGPHHTDQACGEQPHAAAHFRADFQEHELDTTCSLAAQLCSFGLHHQCQLRASHSLCFVYQLHTSLLSC